MLELSVTSLVTTRVVKGAFVLAVDGGGILCVVVVGYALTRSLLAGLLAALAVGPALTVFLLAVRIWLETLLAFFRIAHHTAEMLEHRATIAMNTSSAKAGFSRGSQSSPGRAGERVANS